jgi:hypothetical protein
VSSPAQLSPASRRLRGFALAAVVVGLVVGTFWGDDDNFPFGPFRMFSTTNTLDGHVDAAEVWAVDVAGREFQIEWSDIGLRRAEIEGQMPRFIEDPEALRYVADAYEHFNPDAPELKVVKLRESVQILRDGRPHGEPTKVLLAQWNAS